MTSSEKPDPWSNLAESLGAEPSPPESKEKPVSFVSGSVPPRKKPGTTKKPKPKTSSWNEVVQALGIEVPPEPAPAEKPESEARTAESRPAREDRGSRFSEDRPRRAESTEDEVAEGIEPEGFSEIVDDVEDALDFPEAPGDTEASPEKKSRRRRRRRGGRRDRGERRERGEREERADRRNGEEAALDADDELDQSVGGDELLRSSTGEDDLELSEEGSVDRSDTEEAETGRRRRRRKPRRRRGKSSERQESAAEENGARESSVNGEAEASDAHDDGDSDGEGDRSSHRGIPSWDEAVGIIIAANLDARSKNPGSSGAPRGRGRGRGRGKSGGR